MDDQLVPIQDVQKVGNGVIGFDGSPLDPNLPKDYDSRFKTLVLKADFSNTIFAHIANGGTLITLAELWGVRHSDIANYISTNPELEKRYELARIARDEWEKERCIQELRSIATVDIRQAYNENGSLKKIKDMPANVAAALSSVEVEELFDGSGQDREMIGYTKKVKFWDKAKAIELFMKKHGILIDRQKVDIGIKLEDLVQAASDEDPKQVQATVVNEQISNQSAG